MKTLGIINNRLRWLSTGISLGLMLAAWIRAIEDEKTKANTVNTKFNEIINKETFNA